MLFSESGGNWVALPRWVEFLLKFGHDLPPPNANSRAIALVSMPCDSAAAALITLGAIIRDLADPNANDIAGHYERLLRHAQHYLEACKNCELQTCDPKIKRCGYISEASGRVKSLRFPRRTYIISERSDLQRRRLFFEYRNKGYWPNPTHASDWYFEGDTPLHFAGSSGSVSGAPYEAFFPQPIHAHNLRKSYSGLCLVGRAAGENATRQIVRTIRFRDGSQEFTLEDLLTIQGWSRSVISRATFFNSRTERFNCTTPAPRLAIADGDAGFLKALARPELQQSDVVGVFSRTIDRQVLESIGAKLESLRQWYDSDQDAVSRVGTIPEGIAFRALKRTRMV